MIGVMSIDRGKWEKRGIELPPGWHDVLLKISEVTGVSLKYLYTVAVDRLLSDDDIKGIGKEAWDVRRDTSTDLEEVSARHTVEAFEKRHGRKKGVTKRTTSRRKKG